MFITIEGIDGSGKSSVAKMLTGFLRSLGIDTKLVREPNGVFRDLIFNEVLPKNNNRASLLAFLTNRAIHIQDVIKPALDKGKVVICDRFISSTKAYLYMPMSVDYSDDFIPFEFINLVNSFACLGIQPDLEFLMDISVDKAIANIENRGDIPQSSEFLERVTVGYQKVLKEALYPIAVIDSDKTLTDVMEQVIFKLNDYVLRYKPKALDSFWDYLYYNVSSVKLISKLLVNIVSHQDIAYCQ